MTIADDHIHLFVECDPKWSPSEIAKQFKGYSGRVLLKKHPEIQDQYFWNSSFWKIGYFVSTAGKVSEETVRKYIERSEHS